ncbi:MAG: hypothetical protein GQ574_19680 [Crocinitomix sp.]|nr:hypothetical protein [Crocinitomix sp.]
MSDKIGKGRVTLKEYFESDKMPTEGDFADLVDSSLNKTDDQLFIKAEGDEDNPARFLGIGSVDPESPLSIRNRANGDKLIGFEDTGGDEEWHISINPEEDNPGFLIQNNDNSDAALLLDATGRVGIGTKQPEEDLHVDGNAKITGEITADKFEGKVSWNNLTEMPNSLVPMGVVVMWSGNTNNIPLGWAMCNGKNGTPDLRGRFVLGEGKGINLTKRLNGDIGGKESITLTTDQIPAHKHTLSENNIGSIDNGGGWLDNQEIVKSISTSSSGLTTYYNDVYDGDEDTANHASTGSTSAAITSVTPSKISTTLRYKEGAKTDSTGGDISHDNMTPFFVLIYIMKTT